MDLSLQKARPLSNLHGLQDLSEDIAPLVHGEVVEAVITQQDLLRDEVNVPRRQRGKTNCTFGKQNT